MKRILVFLVICFPFVAGSHAVPPHDFHVSYGRMVVEGESAYLKVRMFTDDLENTLRRDAAHPAFKLGPTAEADSLFLRYAAKHLIVNKSGTRLPPEIIQSGQEDDMWWYVLGYEASSTIRSLDVTYTIMFDMFDDQRNIFKILQVPGDNQQTYYFTRGVEKYNVRF